MSEKKAKVAVFISGGGSNLKALIEASRSSILDADIVLVVSNKAKAFGLTIAKEAGIETFIFKNKNYKSESDAGKAMVSVLEEHQIKFIALAGYLRLLPATVVKQYPGRILNIHPALLPKYGGKGMYGHFVHEAVIAAGDKESGLTFHLADEIYDNGRIIEQVKVPVLPDDTPESLAARVLKQEHHYYARVLNKLIKGEYK